MPAGLADGLALALRKALPADHRGTRPNDLGSPLPGLACPGTRLMCANTLRQPRLPCPDAARARPTRRPRPAPDARPSPAPGRSARTSRSLRRYTRWPRTAVEHELADVRGRELTPRPQAGRESPTGRTAPSLSSTARGHHAPDLGAVHRPGPTGISSARSGAVVARPLGAAIPVSTQTGRPGTWTPEPNQAPCLNGEEGFTRTPHLLYPFASCWSASSPTSVSGPTCRTPRRPRQRTAHCPLRNDQTRAFAPPHHRTRRDIVSRSLGSRRGNAPR